MPVPKLEEYYPSEEGMDARQLAFYKELETNLNKGEYLDIEGNISYVFVFLYKLLSKWNTIGLEDLSKYLIYISELYRPEVKLSNYCLYWAYDCLLGLKEYETFLELTEPKQLFGYQAYPSNVRLNIQRKIGFEANPLDILLATQGRKTKFIVENETLYKEKIIDVFSLFAKDKGGWFEVFNRWEPHCNAYAHHLFSGAPLWEIVTLDFNITAFDSIDEYEKKVKELSKDAESLAREEMGLPKVGEGWISETTLFRKLESTFSTTKVIHHGHPEWLGRQHFDIWMPNWKIAVEYQGKQHFEPVEFFGGQETFEQTVKRDRRKANLAKQHGVRLFAVKEDEDQDEVIQKIYTIIENRKVLPPKT